LAHPTRRRVLTAAAALPLAAVSASAVSGCGLDVLGTPPPPPADVRALQAAIAGENEMVARYRAVLAAATGLPPVLRSLLAEHQAHLAQLQARLVMPAGSAASPSGSPPRRAAPTVPREPAAAVAFLGASEQSAAAAMLNRVPRAPASMAQLFASISASEATHVPVLAVAATAALSSPPGDGGRPE
jgi:hypothetical protein